MQFITDTDKLVSEFKKFSSSQLGFQLLAAFLQVLLQMAWERWRRESRAHLQAYISPLQGRVVWDSECIALLAEVVANAYKSEIQGVTPCKFSGKSARFQGVYCCPFVEAGGYV